MKTFILGFSLLLFAFSPAAAQQTDAIGHIQTFKGAATILRGAKTLPVTAGAPLYQGDTVKTEKNGSVGIVMTDESSLSLGPNSEIALKDYLFNPKEGKFSYVARMVKGTFAYLSGVIGKLSPNSIHLETPEATIAVRGTRLLITIE